MDKIENVTTLNRLLHNSHAMSQSILNELIENTEETEEPNICFKNIFDNMESIDGD